MAEPHLKFTCETIEKFKFGDPENLPLASEEEGARIAGYIASELITLRNLTAICKNRLLTYFLEMAYYEAFSKSNLLLDDEPSNQDLLLRDG